MRYAALGVFTIAVLSDFFDGLVARIKKEKSDIGAVIDPLADKLLLIVAFVSLYLLQPHVPSIARIPLWVVLVVVSRDLIILLGIASLHFLKIEIVIAPTFWGKLTTLFQMSTIFSVLLNFFLSPYIWILAVVCTIISGIEYIKSGMHSLNTAEAQKRPK